MPRSFKKLIALLCLPGIWMSWLTLVLIAAVLVGVVAARFGVPVLVDWGVSVPVLGSALTLNGLTDLQWYIFALLVLFGGVCTFRDDAHGEGRRAGLKHGFGAGDNAVSVGVGFEYGHHSCGAGAAQYGIVVFEVVEGNADFNRAVF